MRKSKVLLTFSAMVAATGVTGCARIQDIFSQGNNVEPPIYGPPEVMISIIPETEEKIAETETESELEEMTTEPVYVLSEDDYLFQTNETLYGPPEGYDWDDL